MKSGRRNFMQFFGLVPATAVTAFAGVQAAQAASLPGSALTRSAFAPLVGDDFVFETGALDQVTARLATLDPLANPDPAQDPEGAFRLVFETKSRSQLTQRTFSVSHPRLG